MINLFNTQVLAIGAIKIANHSIVSDDLIE